MEHGLGLSGVISLVGDFLADYSESFLAALALWPVASLAATLPILAYLYHRDGRLRFASIAATYLAVLYVLGIGCFTLYPLPQGPSGPGITYGVPWQLDPLAFVGDLRREGLRAVPQIAFNVVLFIPLGFITGRLLRLGFFPSVMFGLVVSFAVEAAQGTGLFGIYPYAYRTADVNDLMWNTLGTAFGWLCSALLGRVLPPGALAVSGEVTHTPGFVRRCVAFSLDTVLIGLVAVVACAAIELALRGVPGGDALRARFFDWPWVLAVGLVAFVVVEGVIPWMHDGSTPGGGFVRMSCETRPRADGRRVLFYFVRLTVLGFACLTLPLTWWAFALFYLFARRMPYDYA